MWPVVRFPASLCETVWGNQVRQVDLLRVLLSKLHRNILICQWERSLVSHNLYFSCWKKNTVWTLWLIIMPFIKLLHSLPEEMAQMTLYCVRCIRKKTFLTLWRFTRNYRTNVLKHKLTKWKVRNIFSIDRGTYSNIRFCLIRGI